MARTWKELGVGRRRRKLFGQGLSRTEPQPVTGALGHTHRYPVPSLHLPSGPLLVLPVAQAAPGSRAPRVPEMRAEHGMGVTPSPH